MSEAQKVTKVATQELTAQDFLDQIQNANGQMDLLNEALGKDEPVAQTASAPVIKQDETPVVVPPKAEEAPPKNVEAKKDVTADKLAIALGTAKPAPKAEEIQQNDKLAEFDKLAARNAELERTASINEETETLRSLIVDMPDFEAPLVIAEIEKLIASPIYGKLHDMTPQERAAFLVTNARGLAVGKVEEARLEALDANKAASETLTKIISGSAATPSGGKDGKQALLDLRIAAAEGNSDARSEYIYEATPGAKDFVDKILKTMT